MTRDWSSDVCSSDLTGEIIAKKLICILRGFGMNILAYDLYPDYNFAREIGRASCRERVSDVV